MAQSGSPAQRGAYFGGSRVAFFGGSFDPPHLGHLAVAHAARAALSIDLVLFAPVGAQPLKPKGSSAPFEDRVAMTELAIADEPAFGISLLDAPNPAGAPNYTLHTLRRLQTEMPGATIFCLVGADSFLSLRHWYGAAEVPFSASLVVASRPGQKLGDLAASIPVGLTVEPSQPPIPSADREIELVSYTVRNAQGRTAALYVLPGLDVEISATEIRAQIKAGRPADPARPLISPAVARYIREHGLYQ
ncbi:nicotinate (nicotinamide) nucleotide adenylyltransferase [Occallatibacter riparius]|uniref:Probable nicotinate-nucleotide adenylyltransferase n=1 Tax=Occallatibacter riparius TaxID=1002689 RepID=A0A9J7BS87_9BACT|nr:nicotinate (nicotinamide) nucleotide adenylyltransferase [Occallatibacter riparius]UWZ85447.1 nicotinate (nicotinamide) nucleotide adenylyltransferase [Occallatibacter riparius]